MARCHPAGLDVVFFTGQKHGVRTHVNTMKMLHRQKSHRKAVIRLLSEPFMRTKVTVYKPVTKCEKNVHFDPNCQKQTYLDLKVFGHGGAAETRG